MKSAIVNFYGQKLNTIQKNGIEYAAMKPIVEGMDLAWQRQCQKLQDQKEKFGCNLMVIPSRGGMQATLCIPLTKLNGWLFSINPEKVKPKLRSKIIQYQEECFLVLYNYWHLGAAIDPEKVSKEQILNSFPEQNKHLKTSIAEATKLSQQVNKIFNTHFKLYKSQGYSREQATELALKMVKQMTGYDCKLKKKKSTAHNKTAQKIFDHFNASLKPQKKNSPKLNKIQDFFKRFGF